MWFSLYRKEYVDLRDEMDRVWQAERNLLQYYNADWLKQCISFKPADDDRPYFQSAIQKYIFELTLSVIGASCLPTGPFDKVTYVHNILEILPRIRETKPILDWAQGNTKNEW